MYVCMYVCKYIYIYKLHVCILNMHNTHIHAYIYIYMYCICIHTYKNMYKSMYVNIPNRDTTDRNGDIMRYHEIS